MAGYHEIWFPHGREPLVDRAVGPRRVREGHVLERDRGRGAALAPVVAGRRERVDRRLQMNNVPGFLGRRHGLGLVDAIARDGPDAKRHENDHEQHSH